MVNLYLFCVDDLPSGWSDESTAGAFHEKFIRGSGAYNSSPDDTSDFHNHAITKSTFGVSDDNFNVTTTRPGGSAAKSSHNHAMGSISIQPGTDTSIPYYKTIKVIKKTGGGDGSVAIEKNVIGMFDDIPVSGNWDSWSDYYEQYFLRGDAVGVSSASNTHTHLVSGLTDGPSSTYNQLQQGVGTTWADTTHYHLYSQNGGNGIALPDWAAVNLYKCSSNNTAVPSGMIAMFDGTPTATYWNVVSASGSGTFGYYWMRYVRASSTASSGNGTTHGHLQTSLKTEAGIGSIDITFGTTGNIKPKCVDVVIAKCFGWPPVPVTPKEDCNTPGEIAMDSSEFVGVNVYIDSLEQTGNEDYIRTLCS